ncbi:MAG: lysophospholipid acyltransferase family protein [Promethearchaeota archaeon]
MRPVTRISCEIIDLFEKLKANRLLMWIFGSFLWLRFKLTNNVKVFGMKNIPGNKNFLLVGNHSSVADAYMLMGLMYGKLMLPFYYITKLSDKEMKSPLQTRLIKASGGVPRKGPGERLVNWMARCLTDPKRRRVAIPPEGMYNEGGRIMKGFTGVSRVYYKANEKYRIPLLPIVTIGADKAYPTKPDADGKFRPRKHQGIFGIIGKPFHLEAPPDGVLTKEFLREQTDFIMERIRKLARVKAPVTNNWKLDQVKRNFKESPREY